MNGTREPTDGLLPGSRFAILSANTLCAIESGFL